VRALEFPFDWKEVCGPAGCRLNQQKNARDGGKVALKMLRVLLVNN
jgi:hypothetical protein